MRILVTGAAGRLGSHVLTELASFDTLDVASVTRSDPMTAGGQRPAVSYDADLRIRGRVSVAINEFQPDVIIHTAGVTGALCESDSDLALAVNVDASEEIARAATAHNARVIFTSSAAIYGTAYTHLATEEQPIDATTAYARQKFEAEQRILSETENALCARIFNLYGPRFEHSLVNRLWSSSELAPVSVQSPEHFVRDYVPVAAAARILVELALRPAPLETPIMNLGSSVARSTQTLIAEIGRYRDVHVARGIGSASYSCADTSLMERLVRARVPRDLVPPVETV